MSENIVAGPICFLRYLVTARENGTKIKFTPIIASLSNFLICFVPRKIYKW